jgi:hypothetical protein
MGGCPKTSTKEKKTKYNAGNEYDEKIDIFFVA